MTTTVGESLNRSEPLRSIPDDLLVEAVTSKARVRRRLLALVALQQAAPVVGIIAPHRRGETDRPEVTLPEPTSVG